MPTRNIMMCYMWWQYLLTRYTRDSSGKMKLAFGQIDGQIFSITTHKHCPGLVGKGYGYIRSFLKSQANKQQRTASGEASGSGGGFMSDIKNNLGNCTIS